VDYGSVVAQLIFCKSHSQVADVGTTGFVLGLSWLSSVTADHTKKVTVNAMGPFMWQGKYKPR